MKVQHRFFARGAMATFPTWFNYGRLLPLRGGGLLVPCSPEPGWEPAGCSWGWFALAERPPSQYPTRGPPVAAHPTRGDGVQLDTEPAEPLPVPEKAFSSCREENPGPSRGSRGEAFRAGCSTGWAQGGPTAPGTPWRSSDTGTKPRRAHRQRARGWESTEQMGAGWQGAARGHLQPRRASSEGSRGAVRDTSLVITNNYPPTVPDLGPESS